MRLNPKDLPHDWKLRLLDSVTKRGSGHTPNKQFPSYWNGGIKWVSLSDSNRLDSGYINRTEKEISADGLKNSSAVLHPKGTVILSRDAGIGKSAVLADEMAVSQHFIAWQCDGKDQAHNWYLYHWLQFMKKEFERMAIGTTIKTIGLPYFKKLKIPYPPYYEQVKIAQVISTWDKAIETIESLIENSRAQLDSLIQRLLDNANWPLVPLGKLGNVSSAGVDKKSHSNEKPVRLLNYLDVLNRDFIYSYELNHWVTAPDRQIANCDIRRGDVFFTPSSETRDDIAHSAVAMEDITDAVYSYHVVRFRLDDPWDLNFRAYAFKSEHFYKQAYKLCEGSGQRYVLSQRYFRDMTIRVPSIKEQHIIGETLRAADEEAQKLALFADKLRNEKKALMQQLLTGKRRVKQDDKDG